jgi:hypothetical protein
MQIEIIQEGQKLELPWNDETGIFLRNCPFGSYNNEHRHYERRWFLTWDMRVDFVGIICLYDTIYLSIPKAATYDDDDNKMGLLVTYGMLLEQYFAYVDWHSEGAFQRWISHRKKIVEWCKHPVPSDDRIMDKVIAVAKFENVFEWMVSTYFENQIVPESGTVMVESSFDKWWYDVNDEEHRIFEWQPVSAQAEDGESAPCGKAYDYALTERDVPDVIIDGECEGQKYCMLINIKCYDGCTDDENFVFPAKKDLCDQFFHKELFEQIYRDSGHTDVKLYSLLFIPDYVGESEELIHHCANVEFTAHKGHGISVWRIFLNRLIVEFLSGVHSVGRESLIKIISKIDTTASL